MLLATFQRGSHDELTRVHRVPATGEPGYSDFRPALCGASPRTHGWGRVMAAPPAEARPPFGYRCPDCFQDI
jgi:hypothetical protein